MNPIPVIFIGALISLCPPCFAETKDYGEKMQNMAASKVLNNIDSSHDHWQGIGRLETVSTCTATLLDTRDETESPSASAPAYVLTAGHCIEFTNGNIVTDKPVSGTMTFNYFADTSLFKSYPLKAIIWRSMQGVDMAIVELDVTLQKLIENGIQPLKLARDTPANGTDVLIVGAPKGFDEVTLRMAACTLQPSLDIVEGAWVWRNTFMTRCKDVRGGSSGSPLLDRYSNEILGVVGTGNFDDWHTPCDDHAPCTPVGNTYSVVQGNIYGNPTAFLNGCFSKGRIAANPPSSCQLYPAFTIATDAKALERYKRVKRQDDGSIAIPTWNYRFSISTAFYRYKSVRTAVNCESPHHYSDAVSSTDAVINSEIGTESGFYFLCILGVDSATQRPELGLLKNALSVPVEILDNSPTTQPILSIETGVIVTLAKTEEPYRSYSVKFGPVETTDCHQPDKYTENVHMDFRIESKKLPGKLCTIAYDKSGQASEPRIDLLSAGTRIHTEKPADTRVDR